jgi:N-acetylglucosamine-6-phosphate deacetylase
VITRRISVLVIGLALALFTRARLGQTRNVKALGQVGTLAVPAGAEVISTEGMTVLPGLRDMHVHLQLVGHADYDYWDKTYPPAYESIIFRQRPNSCCSPV